jgi:GxxExxY protein
MHENELSHRIIGAAIEVHQILGGPGLLEAVYEEALVEELRLRGMLIDRQQPVPVSYKGKLLTMPLRFDLRVNQLVLVECKATTEHNKVFESQLLTYLRLTGLKLGLVINFGQSLVKDGVHRVVNGI